MLTEGADGSHNTEWLPVLPRLHILSDLEDLASKLARDTASMLSDLQTTEHITLSIGKGLALLESDARSESVPVLPDKCSIPEHDLLP